MIAPSAASKPAMRANATPGALLRDEPDDRIGGRDGLDDLHRIVGGIIVYHNNFENVVLLLEKSRQAGPDVVLLVASWYDDR